MANGHKIAVLLSSYLLAVSLYGADRIVIEGNKKNAVEKLNQLDQDYVFRVTNKTNLPNSKVRYKLTQFYKDIWIWNMVVIATKDQITNIREEDLVSGVFLSNVNNDLPSVIPSITKDDAIYIATRTYREKNNSIKNINYELSIKTYGNTAKLIYIIDYFVDEIIPKRPFYIVDANTAEIIEHWQGLPTIYS